ncbi:MAG TPA: hypothetical protein VM389_03365, partial [Phycisphaerae bacterium]|nr:hypothetical protein [Phycisphaerae bacterium]
MIWRGYLAEDIGKARGKPFAVPNNSQFEVHIDFYLLASRVFLSGDLDNLAKPVLDTLFCQ